MKLTNQQILSLSEAITQLDGQHVNQLVEGKLQGVFKSYSLASTARWTLARAQGMLHVAIADFNRAKDALINHHSGGTGQLNSQHANFNKFAQCFEGLKREEAELDLPQIALESLRLDENEKAGHELPIAVLTALQPLISGTQPSTLNH